MLNSGVSPSVARESSLSQILQDDPPRKYYLSKTACLGILRRAEARGKELPPQLRDALILQAGLAPSDSNGYNGDLTGEKAATLGVNVVCPLDETVCSPPLPPISGTRCGIFMM